MQDYNDEHHLLEEDLDFEIPFYEDILRSKPDLVDALIVLGDAYTRKGLYDKGLEVDLRLAKLRPRDAVVHYNLACDYALLKRPDEAIATLDKALKLGYRAFEHMSKDPDLDNIRNDGRFAALVAKYRNRKKTGPGRISAVAALMLLPAACWAGAAFAETIVFKSGEKIDGTVIEKSDNYVKIDYKGALIVYHAFEIETIDGKSAREFRNTQSDKMLRLLVSSEAGPEAARYEGVVPPDEHLRRGTAYQVRNEFDMAIAELTRAIKGDSGSAEAFARRGIAYYGKGEAARAIADYSASLAIDPKNDGVYYLRGLAHAAARDRDRAVADYAKAIELNPKNIDAYLGRGLLYAVSGETQKAVADVSQARKIDQNVPAIYYIRGVAYANAGQMDQAIADYTRAIELRADYADAYINRALAYTFRDKIDLSNAEKDSPKLFVNLGPAAVHPDDIRLALADCDKVISLAPKHADAYVVRARVHLAAKDFDKAWADVRKAEELGGKASPEFLAELRKASGREK